MATLDLLKLAKSSGLTAAQKRVLKKKFVAKKRELAREIKAANQGLKVLAKRKPKKARAKR